MTRQRILVVHIMKAAGTSLRRMLVDALGRDAVYPNDRDLKELPKRWYPGPRALIEQDRDGRSRGARVLIGHLPYVVADEIEPRPVVVALLRDPVARAVSMLEHRRRLTPRWHGASLADLLDDEEFVDRQVRDYQTKTFAFDTVDECPDHVNVPLRIDEARFQRACARLDAVDVLGTIERMDSFARRFAEVTGIQLGDQRADNTGGYEREPLDPDLQSRLESLVARDVELYRRAQATIDAQGWHARDAAGRHP